MRSDSTLIEEITSREEIKNVNNVILVETNTPLILGWNVESLEKENLSHHHMHCFYNETTKTFLAFTIWVKKRKSQKNIWGKRYSTFKANRE